LLSSSLWFLRLPRPPYLFCAFIPLSYHVVFLFPILSWSKPQLSVFALA
jgi:hypothetical protein